MKESIKALFGFVLVYAFRIFPIKNKKVYVSSFFSNQCNDSPLYIANALQQEDNTIDIVWVLPNTVEVPTGMRKVQKGSIKSIYELVTAKVWIDNCRKQSWVRKRKRQYYIQTWHGGVGLKKVEGDAETKLSETYIKKAKNDSKMADLFIAECKWRAEQYRRAFWYEGEILESGLPRSDVLVKAYKTGLLRKKYGLNREDHIMLYAPTFREDKSMKYYNIDYEELEHTLEQKYGGIWYIIVRMHPNALTLMKNITFTEHVLDGSLIEDVNTILPEIDILLTDYSSIMFDAMRCDKKVFLYAVDLEEYSREERGLNFQIEELPVQMSVSMKGLLESIRNSDEEEYEKQRRNFMRKMGYYNNNNASFLVAKRIIEVIYS